MLLKRFFFGTKDFLRLAMNCAYGGGACLICGKDTFFGEMCGNCRDNLLLKVSAASPEERRCTICGKTLLSEKETCMSCRKERVLVSTDFVFPMFPYRMWAKNFMFSWKMMEKRGLSSFTALLCHKALESRFNKEQKVIVPVPPRPGKIRVQGWDQIDETCSILQCRYGYKVLKLLRRTAKVQQKKLDRSQRLDESKERYVLSKKGMCLNRENLPNRVILVDDVMTTGITVESCAKVLKSIGIEKVDVLTLFIVD